MKIKHLINNTYQVVTGYNILFQGTLQECQIYIVKDNPIFNEFVNLFNQK